MKINHTNVTFRTAYSCLSYSPSNEKEKAPSFLLSMQEKWWRGGKGPFSPSSSSFPPFFIHCLPLAASSLFSRSPPSRLPLPCPLLLLSFFSSDQSFLVPSATHHAYAPARQGGRGSFTSQESCSNDVPSPSFFAALFYRTFLKPTAYVRTTYICFLIIQILNPAHRIRPSLKWLTSRLTEMYRFKCH